MAHDKIDFDVCDDDEMSGPNKTAINFTYNDLLNT
jgi:hypothetical protein